MAEPSKYELAAWKQIQEQKRGLLADTRKWMAEQYQDFVDNHEWAQKAESWAGGAWNKGKEVSKGAGKRVPKRLREWTRKATESAQKVMRDVGTAFLTEDQVVKRYAKKGHAVSKLTDVRSLDLEHADKIRRSSLSLKALNPLASASGAGAAFAITGGQTAVVVSSGAATAPGAATIGGALAGDIAWVTTLSNRVVGQIGLIYGYHPNDPGEQLFARAIFNLGSASSSSAKMAALADISRLTQGLVRGQTWVLLNESLLAKALGELAKRFGTRLTKQKLGSMVPVAGVAIAATFNWATLSSVAEAADLAYRRRFLLEKYPQLAEDEEQLPDEDTTIADEEGEVISVIEVIEEMGQDSAAS